MRIFHVIPGLQKAAGTTAFVENAVAGLRERGHEVEICTKFGDLVRGKRPDVVHIHGVWPLLLHRASRWAWQNGITVVWSTHGMTAPWSMRHKWWKKIVAWWLYQRRDLKRATVIHCTTELEAGWNRALGLKNQFAVVPLGASSSLRFNVQGLRSKTQGDRPFIVLFVGRIHPVKGLMNLMRAAGMINRAFEESNDRRMLFRIVGPDEVGHMAELKAEIKGEGIGEQGTGNGERVAGVEVVFTGAKHGEELEREYENCDVLVLPSWTENFGGVVVDALAHGKPVIASRFTPWKVLEDERCGWWVDNSPETLAAAIKEACGAEGLRTLPEMGARGRRIVEEHYTWSAVCEKLIEAYRGVGVGKMKVLHLVARMGQNAGGPPRSAQGLVAALCRRGVDAWICPFDGTKPWFPGIREYTQTLSTQALKHFDLVHIHGIWDWRLHRVAVKCRKAGIKYVIAPRGMLEPWALNRKWLKKRIARWLYQDKDLRCAAALHATAESEAEQFRRLGFKNKIIVAPNGVNVPEGGIVVVGSRSRTVELANTSVVGRRALFVSRMHPKKGVLELVESWARIKQSNNQTIKQWSCELVYTVKGAEEKAYEQKVKDRILALGMSYQDKDGTIHGTTTTSNYDFLFTGPLDDTEKWNAYARADLFVLPTYSENFGIVVAEALWAGVPVITTKGAPWAELECSASSKFKVQSSKLEERCGWWVELSAFDSALHEAIEQSHNPNNRTILQEMGARGHQLVEERYTWAAVCDKMIEGYRSLGV